MSGEHKARVRKLGRRADMAQLDLYDERGSHFELFSTSHQDLAEQAAAWREWRERVDRDEDAMLVFVGWTFCGKTAEWRWTRIETAARAIESVCLSNRAARGERGDA